MRDNARENFWSLVGIVCETTNDATRDDGGGDAGGYVGDDGHYGVEIQHHEHLVRTRRQSGRMKGSTA